MSEAVRSFAERTDRVDALVPAVARYVGESVNATCIVRLLSEDGRFLNPSALWCPDGDREPAIRRTFAAAPIRLRPGSSAYEALHEQQILNIKNPTAADLGVELRPELGRTEAVEPGPLLAVPLKTREDALGLVYVVRQPSEPRFEREEAVLVEDLCNQAAVALGNALRIRSLQSENDAIRRDQNKDATKLRHVDAMAALASGLAHDYDNLISVIQMCTNLRLEALGHDDPSRGELEKIRQACDRAAELTPLLSVLTRRQFLQPELLDPAMLVGELRPGLDRIFGDASTLHLELADVGPRVCVDRPQFIEAVTDLVVNARRALVAGGSAYVRVETRSVTADDLLGVRPGTYAVVSVEDDGVGMDPDTVSKVTRPFFRRWASRDEGPGLGLTTVMAFARQCEGTVTVTSQPTCGTTVSLFLPVVVESLTDPQAPRPELDGIETVLLAVKDFGYRVELREMLRRYGYQVLEAQTYRHAEEIARAFEEPIHLMVIDAGAAALASRLTERRSEAATLTVSAHHEGAPSPNLVRGQQDAEVLSRVRRALGDPAELERGGSTAP